MLTSLALVLALGLPADTNTDRDSTQEDDRAWWQRGGSPGPSSSGFPFDLLGTGSGGGGCLGGSPSPLNWFALPAAALAAVGGVLLIGAAVTGGSAFFGGLLLSTLVKKQEGRTELGAEDLLRETVVPAEIGYGVAVLAAGGAAVVSVMGLVGVAFAALNVAFAGSLVAAAPFIAGGVVLGGGAVTVAGALVAFGVVAMVMGVSAGILAAGIAADRMPPVE